MWKKAKNNQPAVGMPVLVDRESELYHDSEGDVVFPTSPDDFPKPVEQTAFMGIKATVPEGTLHEILVKVAADVAEIKKKVLGE